MSHKIEITLTDAEAAEVKLLFENQFANAFLGYAHLIPWSNEKRYMLRRAYKKIFGEDSE